MEIAEAQRDLRRAYVGGGPGVLVSGIVWLCATVAQSAKGVGTGFAVLFIGGMLIFPVSKLTCRIVFGRRDEAKENPLGMTVLEGTIPMIGGLFAAWLFIPSRPALVFPLAAIAVGTHYLIFKTAYGTRFFWLLAAIVAAIGFGDIFVAPLRGSTALLVCLTELAFGLMVVVRSRRFDDAASD